ncbi:MAG: glycogen/starch synthase [Muribaculaceae bacterium]|nr:glycogen/starch synthase [Muribaculaceae bacterium]
MPNVAIDYIFEASWEVCNKIGGIYTVLSTKAKTLQKLYKDRVIFIGPDVWTDERPAFDFTESKTVLKKWRETALLPEGLEVRVGRWDIPGKPIAILVKFDSMYASKDEFYGHLWERFGVDSLHAYGDYDEACAFGRAAAAVIESLVEFFGDKANNVIVHFDEWTLGTGLLTVKERVEKAATVFTTHATSIGRSICGNGKPLYDYLPGYDGDQMARELNMESKHSLEKAAAREADCFTTVSDVTARESEQLLCRRPDVVTPNGFEPGFVPAKNKFKAARSAARKKMLDVARALTGRAFDDNTFIMATSGRCEYRNKGIDVYCDALARLNENGTPRPVLAFVMVPAWAGAPRADLMASISEGHTTRLADPVLTHALHNYNEDPINRRLHELGFAAAEGNGPVTAIYVPCYLNGHDGIFNMSYYDLLIGMDATVFPSYYEPWGYTPLESVAFGVPTITTTLSGFGQWICSTSENSFADCGAVAVKRTDSNYGDVVKAIADDLTALMALSAEKRAEVSDAARQTAARADWSNFIVDYEKAYNIALTNHNKKQ